MSDMGNYELEDIVWELSDNDDHIVPFTGDKKGYAVERGDKLSQPRVELKYAESNVDSGVAPGNTTGMKEEASLDAVKEDQKAMLGKSTWGHSSNEERMPTPCFSSSKGKSVDSKFCADEPVVNDQAFTSDNNLKQYQLTDASCTENDLAFLRNGLEDKGSDDLLFYGWPELENFEDVDNMLRNCDPTFALDIDNCGDLSWLSSSHTIEGSNDALKSGFAFPGCDPCGLNSVTEQQDVYGRSNESNKNLTLGSCERDLHKFVPDARSTITESYGNESRAVHHIDTQSQIHGHVSPSKHQKSPGGKRKNWSSGNGISFIQFDKLNEAGEENHLLNSQHNFSPENQQLQDTSRPWLQTPKPVIKSNHQTSDCVLPSSTPSTTKSEAGVLPKMSPRDSSHASINMHSVESSRDISFKNITESKKKGKLHQRRLSRHTEKSNLRTQRFDSDQSCDKKPITKDENEAEGQRKIDGCDIGFSGELNSSTIQESSCLSSVMDEPAFDASSLKQLQHVMGQLDIRTKLCIRDSLYRLARSAAQRHKCDNQSNGGGDERDANGAFLSGTNKSTGFIDMETDTNPIDRSIAHLLFHRPSDPSASATPVDAVAMKSHIMVEAPNPSKADKSASREETTLVNENGTEHRT
ncbi:protein LNK1 isoform X1 [Silene latifolia]|uniref:protein LNK1 isoform X1 n=1 Tax=Silene latifolia TaxID=37657 RepID=UPI003D76F13B